MRVTIGMRNAVVKPCWAMIPECHSHLSVGMHVSGSPVCKSLEHRVHDGGVFGSRLEGQSLLIPRRTIGLQHNHSELTNCQIITETLMMTELSMAAIRRSSMPGPATL